MTPAWGTIAQAIEAAGHAGFSATHVSPVTGGSIHAAWRLGDTHRSFFAKTGDGHEGPMFAAEAAGLQAIAATRAVHAPRVVCQGTSDRESFLVLEALELGALDAAAGRRLGVALARMHATTGPAYGWQADNFIGRTPQRNEMHESWPHFFAHRRLRPQLALARENGMDRALVAQGLEVADRIGALFLDYRPLASLLHGDLWSGNAGRMQDGEPAIFDPACYWGDRETDLAMAELFGGFPDAFFAAYREAWPLDGGYERRKPAYNLYHILNHYNLFGAAYLGQAQRMITGLLTTLKR